MSPSQERSSNSGAASNYLLSAAIVLIVGLWIYTRSSTVPRDDEHIHPPGAHGGVIISMAQDRYHAEALIEQGGILRLMMLGRTTDEVIDVEQQTLVAYVDSGEGEVTRVPLSPDAQPGDAAGRMSQFVGQLPTQLEGKKLSVSIAPLRIDGGRYRLGFAWPNESHPPAMPTKVEDEAERQLYLEPGGLYAAADIEANGGLTASQKFVGFKPNHDFDPQPGDLLCPVTRTKANPACAWTIGGRRYTFCCPPCVDEFLQTAKRDPEQVQRPEEYVK